MWERHAANVSFFGHRGNFKRAIVRICFLRKEGEYYADLRAIREKAFGLIGEIAREYVIDSICISSFGESFVLLGRDDEVLFDPMLYTDPRGKEEAEEILRTFGKEIFFATGVVPQSMFSLSKLLWIKSMRPTHWQRRKSCC